MNVLRRRSGSLIVFYTLKIAFQMHIPYMEFLRVFQDPLEPICNSASPTYTSEVSADDRLSEGTSYTRWEIVKAR